ncbi:MULTISPECIES: hypothetical protein [Natrialbaceae]|uniref:hypothetical protein n=1 Tax=Natrialbaceae TaxID=1644061 RepID=UPI00207D5486|nr:hypothetical protein [Natronococcus sp. CG52]
MVEFTTEQQERAAKQLERYRSRAEKHEKLYEEGKVEQKLSTFFSGLASKYDKLAILSVYHEQTIEAREYFETSAEYYLRSAEESSVTVPTTLTLARGLYNAALAGHSDLIREFARQITEIIQTADIDPDEPDADRYYFSGCLAGAILDDVSDHLLDGLATVNEGKPETHALYGSGILAFTRGIRNDDIDQIEDGITTMIEYHTRSTNDENVVDLVMAPEATALLIISRWMGYELEIDSDHIPAELADESASTH